MDRDGYVDLVPRINEAVRSNTAFDNTLDVSALNAELNALKLISPVSAESRRRRRDRIVKLISQQGGVFQYSTDAQRSGATFAKESQLLSQLSSDINQNVFSPILWNVTAASGPREVKTEVFKLFVLQRFHLRQLHIRSMADALDQWNDLNGLLASCLASGRLSSADVRLLVNRMPGFSPQDCRAFANVSRLSGTMWIQHAHNHPPKILHLSQVYQSGLYVHFPRWRWIWAKTDWTEIARFTTQYFDQVDAALNNVECTEVAAAFALSPNEEYHGRPIKYPFTIVQLFDQSIVEADEQANLIWPWRNCALTLQECVQSTHQLKIAIELFEYREANGEFPESLQVLNSLKRMPTSPLAEPAYECTDDGFKLTYPNRHRYWAVKDSSLIYRGVVFVFEN